jgi:caa(3)-type oxidase subunit IV
MHQTPEKEIEDVKRHLRQHLIIAAGIVIGTLLTLFTSQHDFGNSGLNIALTLGVASVQAFMVAAFFMHLLSEKKMIYSFLIFTAIFFVVLMGIDYWAHMPENVVGYKP